MIPQPYSSSPPEYSCSGFRLICFDLCLFLRKKLMLTSLLMTAVLPAPGSSHCWGFRLLYMHTPVFPPTRNIVLWWSDVKKEIVLGVLCPLLFPPTWVFSALSVLRPSSLLQSHLKCCVVVHNLKRPHFIPLLAFTFFTVWQWRKNLI